MAITISGTDGISPLKASGQTQTTTGTAEAPAISPSSDTDSGLFFGTNEVNISTGGTQRATVDSSGNLGVGVSSPAAKLHVQDTSGNPHIRLTGSGGSSDIYATSDIFLQPNSSTAMTLKSGGNVGINNTAPNEKLHVGGKIQFGGNTTYYGVVEHEEGVTGANIYTSKDTGGHIVKCGLTPTERVRITQDGKIRIKMSDFGNDPSSSNSGLQLFDTSGGAITSSASVTSGSSHAVFLNPNGVVGTINTSGSATSYNTSSDYRLKENVVDLDGAITRVKQLAPKRFNFISDADTTVDGFLAHEAQTVVPEAVTGTHNAVEVWEEGEELPDGVSVGDNKLDEDGNTIPDYQGIDQSKLVPLLTAALQEAIGKIETLETQNADLLARVIALEAAE